MRNSEIGLKRRAFHRKMSFIDLEIKLDKEIPKIISLIVRYNKIFTF